MSTILAEPEANSPKEFKTTIKVAGLTVAPSVIAGGIYPDEAVVTLRTIDDYLALSPAEACALAAALQSVAVHLMEQNQEVVA